MREENNFYLVGIKGVAMTALAGCLLDLGKTVRGSDVAEDFVTAGNLARLEREGGVRVDVGFDGKLPPETQVVIFSGANGGSRNPQVRAAKVRGLLVLPHARALAELFNTKKGVAVCGVGGKSTISGMLAFVSEQLGRPQSYAVGVGEIIGLPRTGRYLEESEFFIAEADEYVEDPAAANGGSRDEIVPRFHLMRPEIIVCASVQFDHPDVYRDLAHTKKIYGEFFRQLRPGGKLIYNGEDANLRELAAALRTARPDVELRRYGLAADSDYRLSETPVTVNLPGEFNRLNGLAALAASEAMGWPREEVLRALASYRSVKRRFERKGEIEGVEAWDDYAHHPSEVRAAMAAMQAWRPGKRLVVAFQPHTFSRTKQLFEGFVDALASNPEVLLLDIFPSAREAVDETISSGDLVAAIRKKYPAVRVENVATVAGLREWVREQMKPGEVLLTLGAGDIYQIYEEK